MTYMQRLAVGPVQVEVTSNAQSVMDYLVEFYPATDAVGPWAGWTVEATVGAPDPATVNRWGVSCQADRHARLARLRAEDPTSLAITARKCVREVLVDFCERRRYTMLHASAVVDETRTVVVVGDKGSGKTTLALKAALLHGMRYLSNDHLIVYPTDETASLTLTSLPTLIPLKVGTFLDLEASLAEPWDGDGLDVDVYRTRPRNEVYAFDRRVLYTYHRLGQQNPITVETDHSVPTLIVLATYSDAEVGRFEPVAEPVGELLAHVRTDWMFDSQLNQRHLPRDERDRDEYLADAHRLVTVLAEQSTVVRWAHRGDPSPMLDFAANWSRQ